MNTTSTEGSRGAIDASIDLRGEVCPHPVMLTLEQLDRMPAGKVLQVIVDCPSALVNVPAEVDRHGHQMIGGPARRGTDTIMLVRSAGPRRVPPPTEARAVARSPGGLLLKPA